MCQLLYIIKFAPKNQLYDSKPNKYLYNKDKALKIVNSYVDNEFYWASMLTIKPES